ncbi:MULTISPECIES: DUF2905 domain-containing protein [Pseudothermotoga]|uniref:DUF2905 domain-containing protein n=1 Tax=Pseudothermotoga TaxID=1643951 RepID=UPI00048ECA80|nr:MULTISPECIES: DUF2905 domain-containing protein [Pseudothermotoga]HBJ80512.1 DUF2905 domain-containing protein [Pseudothermotoga sp.]HBT26037.1 DUF2905 domain-containing protein [Pseudothermotoga sp.]
MRVIQISRILIVLGLILIIVGFSIYLIGRFTPLGRLPGDIVIKRERFVFYFPLTTCLLISATLTLIFLLISKFWK